MLSISNANHCIRIEREANANMKKRAPTHKTPINAQERRLGKTRLVDAPDTPGAPYRFSNDIAGERDQWDALLRSGVVGEIPPGVHRRVLIDLEDYYCAYPQLIVSGGNGAVARVRWAEGLHLEPTPDSRRKGNRDEIEGKYIHGQTDAFHFDGGQQRIYDTLWWRAGRSLIRPSNTAC